MYVFQLGIIHSTKAIQNTSGLAYLHWVLSTQLMGAPCQGAGPFQEPDLVPFLFALLSEFEVLHCHTGQDQSQQAKNNCGENNCLKTDDCSHQNHHTWRFTQKAPEFPCVKTSSPIISSLQKIKFYLHHQLDCTYQKAD